MPKAQRSPEEIDMVRQDIMEHALEIIIAEGFAGLSMRKLANQLGVTAKTIYNYFHNKDELYLHLLIRGFQQLLVSFENAVEQNMPPIKQLKELIRAYVNFGLEHANIYNLMFTWHVPKFNDYVGTPMEQVAQEELTIALKCADFFMARIVATVGSDFAIKDEEIHSELIRIWAQMHGYVAGINNNLLDYLHENPLALSDQIIERIFACSQRELSALKQGRTLTIFAKK
jgi:AcrR family transcriptional regulator